MKLEEFIKSLGPAGSFQPSARYCAASDSITVYLEGGQNYYRPVNDRIFVIVATESERVIGIQVCGIKQLMEELE